MIVGLMVHQFGPRCTFLACRWEGDCSFEGAQFQRLVNFDNSTWGGNVSFDGAQIGEHASFCLTKWDDRVSFSAKSWESLRRKYGNEWEERKEWADSRNLAPDTFGPINFSGAEFNAVSFRGREFLGFTNFSAYPDPHKPTRFGEAPEFFGCTLNPDTDFTEARFPLPQSLGAIHAARAYRVLNRPLKKSRGPKHHQSLTSQNGLQAIFQLWTRGKAPPKSRPFDLKSTFSTAC